MAKHFFFFNFFVFFQSDSIFLGTVLKHKDFLFFDVKNSQIIIVIEFVLI